MEASSLRAKAKPEIPWSCAGPYQAASSYTAAGTKDTIASVQRTDTLNPVTGIQLHRLPAATTGIDGMTISFANGEPETLGNLDALAETPFASVTIAQDDKVGWWAVVGTR